MGIKQVGDVGTGRTARGFVGQEQVSKVDERFNCWPVEVLEDRGDAMVGEEASSGVLFVQEVFLTVKLTKLKNAECEKCTETPGLCSNSQKHRVSWQQEGVSLILLQLLHPLSVAIFKLVSHIYFWLLFPS